MVIKQNATNWSKVVIVPNETRTSADYLCSLDMLSKEYKVTWSHDYRMWAFWSRNTQTFCDIEKSLFLGNWNFCISVWDCENRFRLNRKCLAKEISFMLLFKAVNTECNQLKVYLSLLEGEKLQSLPDCSADKLKIDFFGIGKVVVFFVCW